MVTAPVADDTGKALGEEGGRFVRREDIPSSGFDPAHESV